MDDAAFDVDLEIDAAGPPRLRDMGRIVLAGDELAQRIAIELRHNGDLDGVPALPAYAWVDPEPAPRAATAAAIAATLPAPDPQAPHSPAGRCPARRVPEELRRRIVEDWPAFRASVPSLLVRDAASVYCRRMRALYAVSVSRSTLFFWQQQFREQERTEGGKAA